MSSGAPFSDDVSAKSATFARLGTLENLCELVQETKEPPKEKGPISVGFDVEGGPFWDYALCHFT